MSGTPFGPTKVCRRAERDYRNDPHVFPDIGAGAGGRNAGLLGQYALSARIELRGAHSADVRGSRPFRPFVTLPVGAYEVSENIWLIVVDVERRGVHELLVDSNIPIKSVEDVFMR